MPSVNMNHEILIGLIHFNRSFFQVLTTIPRIKLGGLVFDLGVPGQHKGFQSFSNRIDKQILVFKECFLLFSR